MKPLLRIYTGNGEFTEREMDDSEFAQYQKDANQKVLELKLKAEMSIKRQELLNRLGITEDEAKLLLA